MNPMNLWLMAMAAVFMGGTSSAAGLDPDQCPRAVTVTLSNLKVNPLDPSFQNDSRYGGQNQANWSKVARASSITISMKLTSKRYDEFAACNYEVAPNELGSKGAAIIEDEGSVHLVGAGLGSVRVKLLSLTQLELEKEANGFPLNVNLGILMNSDGGPYPMESFQTIGYAQTARVSVQSRSIVDSMSSSVFPLLNSHPHEDQNQCRSDGECMDRYNSVFYRCHQGSCAYDPGA